MIGFTYLRRGMGASGETPPPVSDYAVEYSTNPAFMYRLWSTGYAAHPEYMTKAEAAAVTSFPDQFMANNTKLTSLDELQWFSLTAIPKYFASGCTNLVTAKIPQTCTWIKEGAFFNLGNKFNCDLDLSNVTRIDKMAFQNDRLKDVILSNNLTIIGDSAFYNNSTMKINTSLSSVTTLGNTAFQQCSSLDSEISLDNLSGSTYRTFLYCTNIPKLIIGNGVTTLGQYTIANTNVKYIDIGTGVTTINAEALAGNQILLSIIIRATTPPTLANINAFSNTNNCPIYVPAESVEAYKAASVWTSLASRIQAIST